MTIHTSFQRDNKTLDVKTKDELFQFVTMRQMFLFLQFYLIEKLDKEKVYGNIDGMTLKIGDDTIKLHYFEDEMDAYISSFQWAVLGHNTVNIFEGIRRYCNNTKQFSKFKNQPWYLYFKIVRHSFSHDCRWNFNEKDESEFPVKYDDCCLYYNWNKKPMTSDGFSIVTFWHLTKDVLNFIKNELQ